jgi:PAS domain S-box-containing protein
MATILIVDDSPVDRELLMTVLKYTGHRLIEAADGAEALLLVESEHPDLVISDVLLPKMDGYEFVRRMRGNPEKARTTVIFYTAVFNEREALELARDCGVSRILSKPTDPQKILEVVTEVLSAGDGENVASLPCQFDSRHQEVLRHKLIHQIEATRQSEERFRLLAEHATDIIFRCRLHPTLATEYANPAVAVILGYEPRDFYTDPGLPFRIVHPESREDLERYLGGERIPDGREQFRWTHKDGRTIWTEVRSTPIYDGEGKFVALEGIARDITERKRMEQRLRDDKDELELRVGERTAELAKANEDLLAHAAKLEVLNRELQEFAHVASHDLQEPLRKIQAFSERVRAKCDGNLSKDACDYLERMQGAASRMQILLNDLLKYSRVNTTMEPFLAMDLGEPLRDVLADLSVLIEKTRGTVEISDLPTVQCDETQMRQLFQNLIGNALKYHGAQSPIVKIYASHPSNRSCEIIVEDNGIGFEEKHLERIFKPFQRLHGRTSPYEGTGMGLAICRKIVERHHGIITARSAPGKGSTFIVTLPTEQPKGGV